jgi:hypothetical protein
MQHHPLFGSATGPEVPGLWTVDQARETNRGDAPDAQAVRRKTSAKNQHRPLPRRPDPPSQYLVPLTTAGRCVIDRRGRLLPPLPAVDRGRLVAPRGAAARPPLVALSMSADDARRMHHVFRPSCR